jgi:hypothetical protein
MLCRILNAPACSSAVRPPSILTSTDRPAALASAGGGLRPQTAKIPERCALRDVSRCSPEGIRTLATAVRGRRPRPLDDGALETLCPTNTWTRQRSAQVRLKMLHDPPERADHRIDRRCTSLAGVLGLEPRMRESESLVLPITPYPNDRLATAPRNDTTCPAAQPEIVDVQTLRRTRGAAPVRPEPTVVRRPIGRGSAPGRAAPSSRTAAARSSAP